MSPKWANLLVNGWRNEHFCSTALDYSQEEDVEETLKTDKSISNKELKNLTSQIVEGIRDLKSSNVKSTTVVEDIFSIKIQIASKEGIGR